MSGTVLDDVTSEFVDAQHIQGRVDDWEERVNDLYALIRDWLPDGWEARLGRPAVMLEPLMRKFGIAAQKIPTLELFNQTGDKAKLEPRGLWIIGYNGRIDLIHDNQIYLIVDRAENFEQPDWQAAHIEHRPDYEKLTQEWLTRILR